MKVKHLIEALKKCDPEAEMISFWEGCSMQIHAVGKKKDGDVKLYSDDIFYEHEVEEGEEIVLYDPWKFTQDGKYKNKYGYDGERSEGE